MEDGYRVGIGLDAHRFAEGRRLKLGGTEIPHDQGLEGHSDADVVYHALADALLGAAGLGDLGTHFPDTDSEWRDADSSIFLQRIREMLSQRHLSVVNVDVVIVAQAPRIAPFRELMRNNIARLLAISADHVNVKGTTTDQMGFIGRGEGIAAQAVALLKSGRS